MSNLPKVSSELLETIENSSDWYDALAKVACLDKAYTEEEVYSAVEICFFGKIYDYSLPEGNNANN